MVISAQGGMEALPVVLSPEFVPALAQARVRRPRQIALRPGHRSETAGGYPVRALPTSSNRRAPVAQASG